MGSELIEPVKVSKSKSCYPPGFRFHPTDEELVLYYLKRKICRRSHKPDIIGEVDVYKWDPEELPGQSKLKSGDRQWFFFGPRDRKYPNGGRSSRATMNGYWKATGKDRTIKRNTCPVGIKKTLVYYVGRAPSGQRTDWVMHEYTMDENELKRCQSAQEHYVLYKIFKKSGPGPKNGEQYGAPFVEEEWETDDDDCFDVNPICLDDSRIVQEEEETILTNDIIEFLNKIVDEPEILPPLPEMFEKSQDCLSKVDIVDPNFVVNEDFLEMNDLSGPQPGSEDLQFRDLDSFCEFEFAERGIFGNEQFEHENSSFMSEVVNHDNHEHPVSYDLWDHDSFASGQTTHEAVSHPSSGVVVEESNVDDNGTDSWFSSALWAFVESIPSTPASATESSALVNRAFERMSSFSRGRNVNLAAAASGSATRRLDKSSSRSCRGIVYLSLIGVLFAILWVFVGKSIKLLQGFVS